MRVDVTRGGVDYCVRRQFSLKSITSCLTASLVLPEATDSKEGHGKRSMATLRPSESLNPTNSLNTPRFKRSAKVLWLNTELRTVQGTNGEGVEDQTSTQNETVSHNINREIIVSYVHE